MTPLIIAARGRGRPLADTLRLLSRFQAQERPTSAQARSDLRAEVLRAKMVAALDAKAFDVAWRYFLRRRRAMEQGARVPEFSPLHERLDDELAFARYALFAGEPRIADRLGAAVERGLTTARRGRHRLRPALVRDLERRLAELRRPR